MTGEIIYFFFLLGSECRSLDVDERDLMHDSREVTVLTPVSSVANSGCTGLERSEQVGVTRWIACSSRCMGR
eukprot:1794898-Amphidinium_carterae.1